MKSSLYVTAAFSLCLSEATFIRKYPLQGCGGSSARCNSLPAGRCCEQGRVVGGSVKIDNLPSYVDIAVPYSGRAGGGRNGATHCRAPIVSQARFGHINCYSSNTVGTGIWIHCSRNFDPPACLNMMSHPKRNEDGTLDISQFGEQGSQGYVDAEEAALPAMSYHDIDGNLITEDEFNKLVDLELAHEANGTLHLLYPEAYPPDYTQWYGKQVDGAVDEETNSGPNGTVNSSTTSTEASSALEKRESVDVLSYVDIQCRGEILDRDHIEKDKCHETVNGASIFVNKLPDKCKVEVYTSANCKGKGDLTVGKGAGGGCYDSENFSSFKLKC